MSNLASFVSENRTIEQHSAFAWLFRFVTPHNKRVFGLFCLSLVASSLALLQPYLTKQVIDEGLIAKQFDLLLQFSLMLLSLGVFFYLIVWRFSVFSYANLRQYFI